MKGKELVKEEVSTGEICVGGRGRERERRKGSDDRGKREEPLPSKDYSPAPTALRQMKLASFLL